MSQDYLQMFTIYDHPADFPEEFVCRRYECHHVPVVRTVIKEVVAQGKTLEEVRRVLNDTYPGLYCLPRYPQDEPTIVEVWL